jgi:hypothetical protein
MKTLLVCVVLGASSTLSAQDIGRSEPPYVEATVTMPTKLINNAEKRCDMVNDLAEKSEMNYRLLGLKIMEKWRSSIKKDKDFARNLMKFKTAAFTVHKDGSIVIEGVEEPSASKNKPRKATDKGGPAGDTAEPTKPGSEK